MPDLTVVVVAYNSGPQLSECLQSVVAHRGHLDVETFIVDNASDDGCVEQACAAVPSARVLNDGTNLGFGGGVNLALAAASAPWILVINPDARVLDGDLASLIAAGEHTPRAAVVRPRVVRPDGAPELGNLRFPSVARELAEAFYLHRLPGGWRFRPLREIGHTVRTLDAYHEPATVDWVNGSVLLLRTAAVREVGGFDEGFFLYWEETDYCRRVADAGWLVAYRPVMTFVHGGGTARTSDALFATYVASAQRFYRKHYGRRAWAHEATMALNFRLRLLARHVLRARVDGDETRRLRIGLEQLTGKSDRALTSGSLRSGSPVPVADVQIR